MRPLTPADRIFILSGAGLSQASGIPTFRDAEGLWGGHDPMQVATPQAWHADRELVRRFYDERREKLVGQMAQLHSHGSPKSMCDPLA